MPGIAIDGSTRLFGIAGSPIVQTQSPPLINALFQRAGFNAVLVPLDVPADKFIPTLRALMNLNNFHGAMITYPFKSAAIELLDQVMPTARMVGAVNALRREPDGSWSGDIFDGKGLLAGLASASIVITGQRILLLGAGGAASAIAFALAEAGAVSIAIFDLDADKAMRLAQAVTSAFPACAVDASAAEPAGADIMINATPVGMLPTDGLPAAFAPFDPALVVVDIVPKPDVPLLVEARRRKCRTVDYRAMAAGQMAMIAQFFGAHALTA